jgi:hypothetical protein
MADEMAAAQMVAYFTTCVAQLRGRAVYVQFSTHKELKTDQTHSNAVRIDFTLFNNYLSSETMNEKIGAPEEAKK